MASDVGRSRMKRLSALVVDDDVVLRMLHTANLQKYEFETRVVENGKLAVDLIKSGQEFDVIFMDFNMPVLNGIEATRELRHLGVQSMVIGISDDEDHKPEYFIEAGMDQFYKKPLKAHTIISVLRVLQEK